MDSDGEDSDSTLNAKTNDIFNDPRLKKLIDQRRNNPDPTYMGVSDFGVLDEDFDDGSGKEPKFDPNNPKSIGKRILWAAQNNHLDVIQELFENSSYAHLKLPLTVKDEDGYTPLHRACYSGHTDIVKYLLDHGSNPRARTNEGWEPLHCAAFWSNPECMSLLLNHDFDISETDKSMTPQNNQTTTHQHMVNATTKGGLTPLHLACQNNASKPTIELLLFHPFIDLTLKTPMGDTAFNIAERKFCPETVTLFQAFYDPSLNVV